MARETLRSQPVGDMVQGVSQQAAELRRDSQAEAQFDCRNDAESGVVPRPHFEFISRLDGEDFTGGWFYELARGNDEHYLAVVSGGAIRVFDLEDGSEGTVTGTAAYLTPVGAPRDAFDAQTIDDYTFILSKEVAPAMTVATVPLRPKEALVFCRAGGYLTTYTLAITYLGKVYIWKYSTPDNSNAINAAYINTAQIAATFYRALTHDAAPATNSGDTATSIVVGTQATHPGIAHTNPAVSSTISATSLGFEVQINGNILRIWRDDGVEFTIDTSDGQGDTHLKAFKDQVPSFGDLPKNGFEGMVFRVSGTDRAARDDYFVQYSSRVSGDGVWEEIAGPGSHTTIDPATMPHVFINTGPGTFTFGPANWSTRVAGDEDTAEDPYFIGRRLQDISFAENRLLLLTEGALDQSKSGNEFTFFPDTVQTVLDTDRISIRLTASGNARNQGAALLRKVVQAAEGVFLWAQRAQFRIHSGQEAMKPLTVQSTESTAYEFAETADPLYLGQKLFFVSETAEWSTMRAIAFAQGKPAGDTDLTAHAPEYIPAPVRSISGYDTGRMLFLQTDGAPSHLLVYQYLQSGDDIIQSAWNTWRLPEGTILWSSVFRSGLYVALQREDGVYLLRAELNRVAKDPGGQYATRLDLRVSEADLALSVDDDVSTITLPYELRPDEAERVHVVVRTSKPGGYTRGRFFKVLSVAGDTVTVKGDLTGYEFYVGITYRAERQESPFFIRTKDGPMPAERLQVLYYSVTHTASSYYRIEVERDDGGRSVEAFNGRVLGTDSGTTGTPALSRGRTRIEVASESGKHSIWLINDSPFPSAWVASEYQYLATLRAELPRQA